MLSARQLLEGTPIRQWAPGPLLTYKASPRYQKTKKGRPCSRAGLFRFRYRAQDHLRGLQRGDTPFTKGQFAPTNCSWIGSVGELGFKSCPAPNK